MGEAITVEFDVDEGVGGFIEEMASKGVTEGRDKVNTSMEAGMMEVDCIMGAEVSETFMLTLLVMVMAKLRGSFVSLVLCGSGRI